MNQTLRIGTPISSIRNLVITSTFFFVCCINNVFSQTTQNTYRTVTYNICSNVGGFGESLPNDYAANPTKKYPLIIFLHGSGELGNGSASSLTILNRIGITRLLYGKLFPSSFSYGGANYSFIVVAPQMKTDNDWTTSIQAVIDYCKKTYRVDENRIYLTGLSLGGVTAWEYASNSVTQGQTLAATLLVCPGATASSAELKNIAQSQLPVWVTANTGDPYYPPSMAQNLVAAINNLVPAPPKALLSIFDQAGHDAWTKTYDPAFTQNGLNVYQWMLSHSRCLPQTSPTSPPPVLTADAGANKVITLPTNSVTLDASGSKVSSGSIVSYAWTKISGPASATISSASSVKTSVTNLTAGTYIFQVMEKDSYGSTATAAVTVSVNVSTDPPKAVPGAPGYITLPQNTYSYDGSASTASSGNSIVSYLWTKRSGPGGGTITSPNSAKTTITNLQEGYYVFDLTVTDNKGRSNKTGTYIYVYANPTASTDPPKAVPGVPGYITLPQNSYSYDGAASTASSGNSIVSYLWTKRSGPGGGTITSPNSVKTTITDLQEGYYIFDLTVTDNKGRSNKTGTYIYVYNASSAPIAVSSAPGYITLPQNTYSYDGSLSIPSAGNTIVSYLWTKRSGPAGGTITSPNSVKTTITNLQEGYYIFDLTVTDSKGTINKTGTYIYVYPLGTSKRVIQEAMDTTSVFVPDHIAASVLPQLEDSDPLSITVNPNPVVADMNILIKGSAKGKTNIAIYSINGNMLQQQEFNKDGLGSVNKTVNISKLPSGIYLVQVMVDGKFRKVIRIVKQ